MKTPRRPIHLEGLELYEPGKPIEEVQRESGLRDVVKLASNENPLGPSPRALEAVRSALAGIHRYPDGPARALREALATRHDLATGQIVIGNGSTDLIDLVARAFLGPEDNAVISEGAFARFRQVVRARNGRERLVPMRGRTHDLAAMARAADERTKLVFVANPNNPTGTWNTKAEVEALLDGLPSDALLVLDEAYFEFADDPLYPNGLDLLRRGRPVVVLRTFSKAYGLAGLRVGWGAAAIEVVEAVDRVREPFNANALGQAGALAALDDDAHVRRTVEMARAERARMSAELARRGFTVLPSQANFLFVETGGPGTTLFRRLLRRGVIVRPLDGYGFPTCLRISLGTPAEGARLLATLDALRGEA
jgi:histidinol-phosphate aminotransferase